MATGSDASASVGFLLWHATLRWQRLISTALRPLDLTHVQFVLLAVLWWFTTSLGERPSQRALAEQAGTDPMMTSQVVRTLERKGLLVRQRDPADSRALQLELTRTGKALAEKAIAVVEAVDQEFFAATADRDELRRALHVLAALGERPLPTTLAEAK
ncbi:MAG: MarR family transcriptional regulator [Actinobacteria bacterium]|nr:MarR family transcriptional regulator [Actinomycetota bacterium]